MLKWNSYRSTKRRLHNVTNRASKIQEIRTASTFPALIKLYAKQRRKLNQQELCLIFNLAAGYRASRSPHGVSIEPHALMHDVQQDLLPILDKCTARQLCNLLNAMGKAKYVPQKQFIQGITRRLQVILDLSIAQQQCQALQQQQQQQQQPPSKKELHASELMALSAADLCSVAGGLADLEIYDPGLLASLARHRSLASGRNLSAMMAASLALDLARLDHYEEGLLSKIIDRVAKLARKALHSRLQHASHFVSVANTICDTLWAAAKLGHVTDTGPLLELASSFLSQTAMQQPSNTRYIPGVATWDGAATGKRYESDEDSDNRCDRAPGTAYQQLAAAPIQQHADQGAASDQSTTGLGEVSWQLFKGLSVKQIACLAWSAGLLGHIHPQVYQLAVFCLASQTVHRGKEASPRYLSMVMHGLLAAAAVAGLRADVAGVWQLLALPQAAAAAAAAPTLLTRETGVDDNSNILSSSSALAQGKLVHLCVDAWRQTTVKSKASGTQVLVYRVLLTLSGVSEAAMEVVDSDQLFCIDITCRWRSHPIAIEVDGPLHACANLPTRPLGTSEARTAMLRSLGYAVVRIPVHEWDCIGEEPAAASSQPANDEVLGVGPLGASVGEERLAAAGSAVVPASGDVRAACVGSLVHGSGAAGKSAGAGSAAGDAEASLLAMQQAYLTSKLDEALRRAAMTEQR